MKQLTKLSCVSLLACLTFAGCSMQYAQFKPNRSFSPVPTYQASQTFFISGLGQEQTVDAARICGSADKVARVERQLTAGNILLSIVTLGFYTPLTVRVYCES